MIVNKKKLVLPIGIYIYIIFFKIRSWLRINKYSVLPVFYQNNNKNPKQFIIDKLFVIA